MMDISFHKLSLLNRWRQHRLFCILFCALVISTSAVYAQSSIPNYDFKFKAVGIKEGLSQSTVLSIYQDHYGLMWLGTRNGLNRFDGHSVKVFRNEIGNQHTLAGNTVNKIQEDRERRLWIATDEGLSLFDRKTERFHNFTLPEKNRKEIVDLVIDANGKIWVGSADGLFIFDPAINKFNRAEDRGLYAGIANQYISMLHMEDGKLYIGTNNNGVYLVDTKNRKASHFSADIFEKYSAGGPIRINDVAIDKKGAIWIGTNGSGLYRLNRNGSWNWFSRSNLTPNFKITDNLVRSLTTDFDGNIWVGTFNGLNRIDALGRIQHINYSDRTPSGISHGSIRSLFTTKDGSVWIGTYFGGVNILDQQQENFKHYYHISDSQNSLSYNVVGAFTAISPNRVLIGTERGGINLLDESTGFVKPLQLNLKDNLTIKSLFTSSKGETYVGLFKAGLHQLMLADNKLIPLAVGTNHRLKEAIINSIVEDAEHHLWIGTDGLGGVHRYNTQTRDYEEFKGGRQLQTLLNKVLVKHLYLDEKQTLWIATRGMGLISFDLGTGRIGSYPSVSSISNAVNSISPDRKGGLWLATNGKGVIHFNPQSKKVQHIHAKDGLLNNNVFSIFPWKDNLWISTLTGLSHYSLNKKLFRNYESGGSFPLSELNEGIFFKSPKGRLYIGGNNGLVSFDPAMASKVDSSGTVLVTQVNVLGQHAESIYFLDGKESVDQEIQLRHDQPVFSIDFTSLNYLKPQMDRYSYRLLGLDDSWYALKDRRSIIFSNLPSGEYTFEVRSSSNGVDWVLSNNKINIRVLPAPWLTWWAIALYVIIGVGIIFAIRANELNKGKLQTNLKFEQLEKQRWKEIHDLKLKYFTDVSHEFRTPLTLISGPVEELMEEKGHSDWVKDKLKLVFYNSKRLLLLIDQILDANKIDANRLELHLNSVSINELLSNITNNFIGMADRLGIDLQLEQQEIAGHFDVDIDKFEKILYNLLSNAFKFTSKGGKIIVSYTTESKNEQTWFHFKISDTGVGMTEEEAAKIFERFYKVNAQDSGAGIGLSLTYSLVQLMNGEISVSNC
ncbi:MAG: sensor histidine kinase [Pedobacter sp.]|nr:MAG: sensor histidine kinase [Pedobacter sp.]